MDYEKKYLTGANKEDTEHYFPELKESEDERIRKEIIEYLTITREKDLVARPERQRWITYLEKQKDLTKEGIIKQLEEEFYACGTTPKWFHDTVQGAINYGRADALSKFNAVPSVVSDELRRQERETAISQLKHLNDVYIGDEKQKEQKPAKWSDSVAKEMFIKALERAVEQTKKGYELTDCDKHSWWEDFKAYSGIKPAEWSEEDKKALNRAINICRNDFGEYSETAKFLKSLPKRFNLQPRQEWSEEDEKHLYNAIEAVKYVCDVSAGSSGAQCVEFLKSLRPQPHWKPSEKQINALQAFVGMIHPDARYDAVFGLLEELKAL